MPLPFTPVPLTLQVFVLVLAGYTLGPVAAAVSMVIYTLMGLAGIPVFSGGAAGWAGLTGFTGGYLLSYPLAAAFVGFAARRARGVAGRIAAGLVGLGVIHLAGGLWLAFLVPVAPETAVGILTWSFLPFVGVDVVKVLAAEWLSRPRQWSAR